MRIVETAKEKGMTVEDFYKWCHVRCGALYPRALPPKRAYEYYKLMGYVPPYVGAQMRSIHLAQQLKRIRTRYQQETH